MKHIIFICLTILMLSGCSTYNQKSIIDGISAKKDVFQLLEWQKHPNGETWVAQTEMEGTILSVAKESAGLSAIPVTSPEHADITLTRCFEFGVIGLSPKTEEQRREIKNATIEIARNRGERKVLMNGLIFKVGPMNIGNRPSIFCIIASESNKLVNR